MSIYDQLLIKQTPLSVCISYVYNVFVFISNFAFVNCNEDCSIKYADKVNISY